jgi:purine-binding chemotaxis protein CheW
VYLKVIVFRINTEEYGLDVSQVKSIERLQHITIIPTSTEFIKGIINLRGSIIPIIDLRTRFGIKNIENNDSMRIIVVAIDNVELGLIVDSANDIINIPANAIETPPIVISGNIDSYIDGIAKINERLLIILNPNNLLNINEFKIIEQIGNDPQWTQ